VPASTYRMNGLVQEQWRARQQGALRTRQRAAAQGIETVYGCTLVMLATDQY